MNCFSEACILSESANGMICTQPDYPGSCLVYNNLFLNLSWDELSSLKSCLENTHDADFSRHHPHGPMVLIKSSHRVGCHFGFTPAQAMEVIRLIEEATVMKEVKLILSEV